jgi:hypothetical protein
VEGEVPVGCFGEGEEEVEVVVVGGGVEESLFRLVRHEGHQLLEFLREVAALLLDVLLQGGCICGLEVGQFARVPALLQRPSQSAPNLVLAAGVKFKRLSKEYYEFLRESEELLILA